MVDNVTDSAINSKDNRGIEKRGFNSEYSMGLQEMIRYQRILEELTYYTNRVNLEEVQYLMPYYSTLFTFYLNIKPLMNEGERIELDKEFNQIRDRILHWKGLSGRKKIPYKIIDTLNSLHFRVLDIKQMRNLGISIRKEISKGSQARGYFGT